MLLISLLAPACATTPEGTLPHDMSARQHDLEAARHTEAARAHVERYGPNAAVARSACAPPLATETAGICWTSVQNPTAEHLRAAEAHRAEAASHRAASAALRAAEARACVGISEQDRDMSPIERVEDIASIQPLIESVTTDAQEPLVTRTAGVVVTFRAVPGLTAEWLQRLINCHLARNAARGHFVEEMPNCPLVPKGVAARVSSTGDGFTVTIRAADDATAAEILARAERLRGAPSQSAE